MKTIQLNFKSYSSALLSLGGILLMVIGVYFVFLRPSLLPEDLRYMNSSLSIVENRLPGIQIWLKKVFWVMGGFIFATGLLIIFISRTTFRARTPGAFSIITFAGASSIGLMIAVNFMIQSDSKWLLLAFILPWLLALILYRFRK